MIEQHLFTADCPPLDIWVRTSEYRLSDFLLWQLAFWLRIITQSSKNCHVQFVDCYWPEFSLWRFLPALLEYQVNYPELQRNRARSSLAPTEPAQIEESETERCRRRTPSPVPNVA
ncbi:hypothetical protein BC937DRAFT_89733 [Endogone sp. FLAS-F59071]|nr:hypothetical protein BC937DRAFT_89733 [Endogone sp. FLAS-F59071]|eukprot:RUS22305.1 hypothetical protein BC937DRAFT_89733 [Endogone sp. FLAS-F59071]